MGSGKSTIGKALSRVLAVPFKDLDTFIESEEGVSINTIFEEKGEIYFRKKEAQLLQKILLSTTSLILATGGGTPCYGNVMEDLLNTENLITIYLKCNVDTLTERLWVEKDKRPLIVHLDSKALLNDFIRKHLFERNHFYNKAHYTIACDHLAENELTEKIIMKLF